MFHVTDFGFLELFVLFYVVLVFVKCYVGKYRSFPNVEFVAFIFWFYLGQN